MRRKTILMAMMLGGAVLSLDASAQAKGGKGNTVTVDTLVAKVEGTRNIPPGYETAAKRPPLNAYRDFMLLQRNEIHLETGKTEKVPLLGGDYLELTAKGGRIDYTLGPTVKGSTSGGSGNRIILSRGPYQGGNLFVVLVP
ncbi:MAG: hypothetical protein EXR31_00555 [Betaproteobacteria bacterium]|nr:hypothetical protein [Betaproteobacteria bacterium]